MLAKFRRLLRCAGVAALGLIAGPGAARAAEMTVQFELGWKGGPLRLDEMVVHNAAGQGLRLTRFSAIVSDVVLLRADGATIRLDGQYGALDAENERMTLALLNVPDGNYSGLQFDVGLPPETNHADPTKWPAGHPLNPLVNQLHWGWKGGYVFAAIEGRWRDAAGGDERGFSYHLANDDHRMSVRFLAQFNVHARTCVRLAFDLGKVLGPRRLASQDGSDSTHSATGDHLADGLATAMSRGFFWLGAEECEAASKAVALSQSQAAPIHATPHAFVVPPGFPQPELPADNPLSDDGIELGRQLFNDPRLSGNGRQSCASCHAPTRAFSDRVALSRGADGNPGRRNAMPLFNLAWSPAYAWDGSQPRIRDQALAAMQNPVEMHAEVGTVLRRLTADDTVRAGFYRAFGSVEITADGLGRALEQYLLTQVSADSRFDRAMRGQAQLTEEEKRGLELFITEYDPARGQRGADCFHCHGGNLFTDYGYKNNGLEMNSGDSGRERVTGRNFDHGRFKTPSLRNVALTAPYMHDGRFARLEEVIAHYDHGVQRGATLDPNLAKHPAEGMSLSAADQKALVAFLRTLTDERWGNPPELAAQ